MFPIIQIYNLNSIKRLRCYKSTIISKRMHIVSSLWFVLLNLASCRFCSRETLKNFFLLIRDTVFHELKLEIQMGIFFLVSITLPLKSSVLLWSVVFLRENVYFHKNESTLTDAISEFNLPTSHLLANLLSKTIVKTSGFFFSCRANQNLL